MARLGLHLNESGTLLPTSYFYVPKAKHYKQPHVTAPHDAHGDTQ